MFQVEWCIHFIRIQIVTHNSQIYEALQNMWVSYDQSVRLGKPYKDHILYVEACDSPQAFTIKPPTAKNIVLPFTLNNAPVLFDAGRLISENTNTEEYVHQLSYDLTLREAHINIGGSYLENNTSFYYLLIRQFLFSIIFPFNQILCLHGAVLAYQDKTFFLAGDSGMGKSTACLKLMTQGFSLISDDAPLFTFYQNKLHALSSLDNIRAWENTLLVCPEYQQNVLVKPTYNAKKIIDRIKFPPSYLTTDPRQVDTYVILNRGPHKTVSLQPKNTNSIMHEHLQNSICTFKEPELLQSNYLFWEYSTFMMNAIVDFVKDLDVYELCYANEHLDELPALLKSLCQ